MTVLDRPATPLESLGKGFESVLPYLQSQNVIKAQQAEAEKNRLQQTSERLGTQDFALQKVTLEHANRLAEQDYTNRNALLTTAINSSEDPVQMEKIINLQLNGAIVKVKEGTARPEDMVIPVDTSNTEAGLITTSIIGAKKKALRANEITALAARPDLSAIGRQKTIEIAGKINTPGGWDMNSAVVPDSSWFTSKTVGEVSQEVSQANIAASEAGTLKTQKETLGLPSAQEAQLTRKADIVYKNSAAAQNFAQANLFKEELKWYPAKMKAAIAEANAKLMIAQTGKWSDVKDIANSSMGLVFHKVDAKGNIISTGLLETPLNVRSKIGKISGEPARTMQWWIKKGITSENKIKDPAWKAKYRQDVATFKTNVEQQLGGQPQQIIDQSLAYLKAMGVDYWSNKRVTSQYQSGQVVVVNKEGKRFSLPESEVSEAIKQGYKLETKK